jgi:hypothetical protein
MKRKGRRLGFLGNGRGMGVQEEGWVGGNTLFFVQLKSSTDELFVTF